MKHITLALTVAITLVVAGDVSAKSVWIDVTPDNIDHQPLAFTVHVPPRASSAAGEADGGTLRVLGPVPSR